MKHILIADDEPDIIDILEFRFKKMGYRVTSVTDGQQALDQARELKPDLVLLDFRMPLLSGGEVCKAIKGDPSISRIPVIIMTASSEKSGTLNAREYGADDGVVKPFEPEELLGKIKRLLKQN